jgi:hypothetical protein
MTTYQSVRVMAKNYKQALEFLHKEYPASLYRISDLDIKFGVVRKVRRKSK